VTFGYIKLQFCYNLAAFLLAACRRQKIYFRQCQVSIGIIDVNNLGFRPGLLGENVYVRQITQLKLKSTVGRKHIRTTTVGRKMK
jgi:hypothetical protein